MTAMSSPEEPDKLFASLVDKFKRLHKDGPGGRDSFLGLLRETGYCDKDAEREADPADASFFAFVKWAMAEHGIDKEEVAGEGVQAQAQAAPDVEGTPAEVSASLPVPSPSAASIGARSVTEDTFDRAFSPASREEDPWGGGGYDAYSEMDLMFFDLMNPFDLTNPVVPEASQQPVSGTASSSNRMKPKDSKTLNTHKSADSEFWQDISAPNATSYNEQLMVEQSSARTQIMEYEREDEEDRLRELEDEEDDRRATERNLADRIEQMLGEDAHPRGELVVGKTTTTTTVTRLRVDDGGVVGKVSSTRSRGAIRTEEDELAGEPIVKQLTSGTANKNKLLDRGPKEL